MWRYCATALVAMLANLIVGCPQPIEGGGKAEDQLRHAADDLAAKSAEEATALVPLATDVANDVDEAPMTEENGTAAEPGAEDEAVEVEQAGDDAPAAEGMPPDADIPDSGVSNDQDLDEWDPQAALDPDRILTNAPMATSERPLPSVTAEAKGFAGRWDVVVLHKDGRAALTEDHNTWSFLLHEDGGCTVQQHANGVIWEQDGSWELANGALALALGPAGHRAYSLGQFGNNLAVLTDQATSAVLFCLRIEEDAIPPHVAKRYDTDFGELRLRASGPSYWHGNYGEPEGELVLRSLAGFLTGTWEQGADKGFVVFELDAEGFAGWWWYEASTTVDGEWRGRTSK